MSPTPVQDICWVSRNFFGHSTSIVATWKEERDCRKSDILRERCRATNMEMGEGVVVEDHVILFKVKEKSYCST